MTAITLPLSQVGRYGPDTILLGINQHGRPILWHRSHPTSPHMQISGSTGGGKGGALKPILVHAIAHNDTVIIAEPKPGEFGWTTGATTRLDTLDDIADGLETAHDEMCRRQQLRKKQLNPVTRTPGVAHFTALDHPLPRWTIILDEFAAIGGEEAIAHKDDRLTVVAILALTARLAKQGRSDGIHLVVVTQRPTIEGTFAAAGGAIQANLKARLHFDRDADSLKAFAKGSAGIGATALRELTTATGAGRCVYVHVNPEDGGRVLAGQIWWLEDAQCRPFAEAYTGLPAGHELVEEYT